MGDSLRRILLLKLSLLLINLAAHNSNAQMVSGWEPVGGNVVTIVFEDYVENLIIGEIRQPILWERGTEDDPKFVKWDDTATFVIRAKDGKEYPIPNAEVRKRIWVVRRSFSPAGKLRGDLMELVKGDGYARGRVSYVTTRDGKPPSLNLNEGEKGSSSDAIITLNGVGRKEYTISVIEMMNLQGFKDLKDVDKDLDSLNFRMALRRKLTGNYVELKCNKVSEENGKEVYSVSEIEIQEDRAIPQKAASQAKTHDASPGLVSAYESVGNNVVQIALYTQSGKEFRRAAIVELRGRITFNSTGIVSGVDGFSRLQLAEAGSGWRSITKRELVNGRAILTTEDGKIYTVFNLGIGAFAGQIESEGSSKGAQPAKITEDAPGRTTQRDLVIIPVPAQDKGFVLSRSRFVIDSENGQLVAKGVQSMSLKIDNLSKAQVGMQADYWGLGGEHAFQIDYPNWGNGQFWADITTDRNFPITFKVTDKGYAYIAGRGTIKVKDGKEYRLGYDISEEDWIAGIQNPQQLVREGSCEAAGRLGLKAAVSNLIGALKDSAWEVRRNACEALGLLGDTAAIKALEDAAADREESVRKAAAHALKQIRDGEPKDAGGGFMFRAAKL